MFFSRAFEGISDREHVLRQGLREGVPTERGVSLRACRRPSDRAGGQLAGLREGVPTERGVSLRASCNHLPVKGWCSSIVVAEAVGMWATRRVVQTLWAGRKAVHRVACPQPAKLSTGSHETLRHPSRRNLMRPGSANRPPANSIIRAERGPSGGPIFETRPLSERLQGPLASRSAPESDPQRAAPHVMPPSTPRRPPCHAPR